MSPGPCHDPALRLAGLAAARLMLRRPDPGLEALAGAALAPLEGQALSAALAEASSALFEELSQSQHPLARIARGCRLSAFDLDLLGLAILPRMDDRAAAVVGLASGDPGRRLSSGMALRLLVGDGPAPQDARAALWGSPLWRHGLLRLPDPLQPAGERLLDPSPAVLALLDGAEPRTLPGSCALRTRPPPPAGDSLRPASEQARAWLDAPDSVLLHLVGDPARGAACLARACAGEGARRVVVYEASGPSPDPPWRDLALVALALDAVVALALPDADETRGPDDDLAAPVALLAPARLHLRMPAAVRPARIVLPRPDPVEQSQAWLATGQVTAAEADALGNQTWMHADDVQALAARAGDGVGVACARLTLAPPRPVRMAVIRTPDVPWERLVLDDTTAARLEDLIVRYRLRVPVRFRWRLDHGPLGLVCLLAGDSGVGKTLTAEAIAARIGLPLMRVDLSLVVSKYIGETEKNLSELFSAAEGFSALLFFDEADALFGKRTAVTDAHDRYANIEINYLLQRLESFEGIAVLATNLAQGVDEAFLRRFDLTIAMPRPGPTERLRLWRAHLPDGRVDPGIDLAAVSDRYALTGGEIRNAGLAAAYAAAAGPGRITPDLLQTAITAELAKKGRPSPAWPSGGSS
jgi:AAA+ superfamily predicted ATPase